MFALLSAAAFAQAAESGWQQVAPDVAVRLISSGTVGPDGTALVALEIDMPENTKTYWRVPGETGLALDFDASASSGVRDVEVRWPYPQREIVDGHLDHAYYGHTVLPMVVEITDPRGMLDMTATLGVCSDICIPARASLSIPLSDAAADTPSALRIRQALAGVPIDWDGDAEAVGAVSSAIPGMLAVEISPDLLDTASLIAATDQGEPLFGVPQKSPQPNLVLLPILGKTDNSALDGTEVELTFMTDRGAYVVRRIIQADRLDSTAELTAR